MLRNLSLLMSLMLCHHLLFSQGANNSQYELISRVSFGTLPFDASDMCNPSPNGLTDDQCVEYSDFSNGNNNNFDDNLTNAVYNYGITAGETYDLELVGGMCGADPFVFGDANRSFKVFIDFDGDGIFTLPGEEVYTSPYTNETTPTFSTQITIPLTVSSGEKTMRVVYNRVGLYTLFWEAFNYSTNSYTYGEAEDYTLVITSYFESINTNEVSCLGSSDGEIIITPAVNNPPTPNLEFAAVPVGGTPSESDWSANTIINGLAAGDYDVWARDGDLDPDYVYQVADATIGSPSPITLSVADFVEVLCTDDSNASITFDVIGATPPYQMEYVNLTDLTTNNFMGNVATNLSAGNYEFVLTDDIGCDSEVFSYEITNPSTVSISNITLSDHNGFNVSCFSACDGTALVEMSGGTAPITYYVNGVNNASINNFTNLCAGANTFMVEDFNGCQASQDVDLTSPEQLVINATADANYSGFNLTCVGASDGSITSVVAGGVTTGSYVFSTDGGLTFPFTSNNINALSEGAYTIFVQDENSCVSPSNLVNITPPPALTFDNIVVTNPISCFEFSDGVVSLQGLGGAGGYSYSFDGSAFQANGLFGGQSAGDYNITVQDNNNCSYTENYVLSEPQAVGLGASVFSDYNGQDISCNGFVDGIIEVSASGGNGDYYYQLNGTPGFIALPPDNLISNLPSGNVNIILNDGNGCVSNTFSVSLSEPQILNLASVQLINDVSCFNFSDGSIQVQGTGGTGNYTYFVDNLYPSGSQNPFLISGLSQGDYNVFVVDENGCTSNPTLQTINQPQALNLGLNYINIGCGGENTGSASISVTGGTQPYSPTWSNNETSFSISNLQANLYSVQVEDANSCILSQDFEITQPNLTSTSTQLLCSSDDYATISVTVEDPNPVAIYSFLWDDPNSQDMPIATNLGTGIYTVEVSDQFGCVLTLSDTIFEQDTMLITVNHTNLCDDNPFSTATVYVSGGLLPYDLLWSTNEVTEQVALSSPGDYSVTVVDDNNCQQVVNFTVDPLRSMSLNVQTTPASCKDNIDGVATPLLTGGYPPFEYQWSDGSSEEVNQMLSQGDRSLTIIDSHGCTVSTDFFMNSFGQECLEVYSAFSPNGDQNNDYWHIDNINLYPDALVEVFNRWGDRVYSTINYINSWEMGWNGSHQGEMLPSATYYYVINLNNDQPSLTGTVTIVK